ncbi:hypothetical protein IMG5_003010 [Ichthyophthirius multifiliis]|uniref:GAF domain-containing protein n=1 Tax=Ichthyophthirius multifiliis TaxID=5932 RepID=G0QJ78_ICHMU|nr:hypothetical protein IMG5_003010 [Ichthyophthirius multifiliis]EGR34729.1 hypothetical protein IMG5_003010 [Ichthyophthirius multifiliis]|eukprot:XP_004040033.1 hypothetical protein IMG5_003010 [Ichthyophthirius multifiliis]
MTNKLKHIINVITNIEFSLDLSENFQTIAKAICNVLECDKAHVFISDSNNGELWTKISKGLEIQKVQFGQGIIGHVANSMQIINIIDANKDIRFNRQIDKKDNYITRSMVCMPLFDNENGNLLGVVEAVNKNGGFFTKDDEGYLQIIGMNAMSILNNSINFYETRKNEGIIKNILKMSIELNECNNISQFVLEICQKIQGYLNIQDVKIYILDQQNNKIFTFDNQENKIEFEKNNGIVGFTINQEKNQIIDNAYNHVNFNSIVDINTSLPVLNHIIWNTKGKILGVIQIVNQIGIQNIIKNNKVYINTDLDTHLNIICEILSFRISQFLKNI